MRVSKGFLKSTALIIIIIIMLYNYITYIHTYIPTSFGGNLS